MDFRSKEIIELIDRCFAEDIGSGDHSSLASIPQGTVGESRLLLKQDGVIAGLELGEVILRRLDPNLEWVAMAKDGDYLHSGTQLASARGNVHALLAGERLMLNFMQRLSGVATQTYNAVEIVRGTGATILDTRKTTPGLRLLEKWAVTMGGGKNHRIGLYDMIMLKDNHNDFAGGITLAIAKTKLFLQENNLDLKIIVEARNLNEVNEIINSEGVNRILLDNFDFETTKKAVQIIGTKCLTESSGNINENTIRSYAECGVNFISSGALTHSIYNMDLSLKAIK